MTSNEDDNKGREIEIGFDGNYSKLLPEGDYFIDQNDYFGEVFRGWNGDPLSRKQLRIIGSTKNIPVLDETTDQFFDALADFANECILIRPWFVANKYVETRLPLQAVKRREQTKYKATYGILYWKIGLAIIKTEIVPKKFFVEVHYWPYTDYGLPINEQKSIFDDFSKFFEAWFSRRWKFKFEWFPEPETQKQEEPQYTEGYTLPHRAELIERSLRNRGITDPDTLKKMVADDLELMAKQLAADFPPEVAAPIQVSDKIEEEANQGSNLLQAEPIATEDKPEEETKPDEMVVQTAHLQNENKTKESSKRETALFRKKAQVTAIKKALEENPNLTIEGIAEKIGTTDSSVKRRLKEMRNSESNKVTQNDPK
jgi:hypothetical protein